MLKSVSDRAEPKLGAAETTSIANRASPNRASEKLAGMESHGIFPQSDEKALAELAAAECRVPEINACVDLQRQLIKQLAAAGKDIASAQILLDSLIVSLFLAAEDRHRLRALVDLKEDPTHDFRVFWKAG